MTGIYIASKVKHAAQWKTLRDTGNAPIISTWIDEAEVGQTNDFTDLWKRCIGEASQATVLVVYREQGEVLKGAWAEVGAALAYGVPVFGIGIEEFTISKAGGVRLFSTLVEALHEATRLCEKAGIDQRDLDPACGVSGSCEASAGQRERGVACCIHCGKELHWRPDAQAWFTWDAPEGDGMPQDESSPTVVSATTSTATVVVDAKTGQVVQSNTGYSHLGGMSSKIWRELDEKERSA